MRKLYTDVSLETPFMVSYNDVQTQACANDEDTVTIGVTEFIRLTDENGHNVSDGEGNQLLLNDGVVYKVVSGVPESTNVQVTDVVIEDTEIWNNPDNLQTVYVKYNQVIGQYGLYSDSPATTPILTNNGNPMYLVYTAESGKVYADVSGAPKEVYTEAEGTQVYWVRNPRSLKPSNVALNFSEAESAKTFTFQNSGSITASTGGYYYTVTGYVSGGVVSAMDIDAGSATVSFVPDLFPSYLTLSSGNSGYSTDLPASVTADSSTSQTISFSITQEIATVNLDWNTDYHYGLECYSDEMNPSNVYPNWDVMLQEPWITVDYNNIELTTLNTSVYNDGTNSYYPFIEGGTNKMVTNPSTGLILCASPTIDEWDSTTFIGSEIYEYNSSTNTVSGLGVYITGAALGPIEPPIG